MFPLGPSLQRVPGLAAGLLVALLALLAVLQYSWIGEVSEAERDRMRTTFENDGARFTEEFDRELSRAFLAFQPGPMGMGRGTAEAPSATDPAARAAARREGLIQQARRFRLASPVPQLVRDIYVTEGDDADGMVLSRLDSDAGRFVPVPWPAGLEPLRRRLMANGKGHMPPLDGESAALVLPLLRTFGNGQPPVESGHVIVALDRQYITTEFFPELADRWFGVSREPQVLLAVSGPTGLLYRSDPVLPSRRYLPGDLSMPMFGLRRLESLHSIAPGPGPGGPPGGPSTGGGPGGPEAGRLHGAEHSDRGDRGGRHHGLGGGSWKLVVTHREGSLEAAVTRARRNNLAVSFGVIALLAASFGVLMVSTQRARGLARQQLELVAGITHELNTPLAAIRSAGQNLADGVVAEGPQVRRYGALIEREGARLSGMVAKALELAGIQSGHRAYRPEAVPVAEVVAETLADIRFLLEERKIAVERDLPAGLPPVWADRGALRMALANLLDNAIKYAAAGGFLAVRALAEKGGRQIALTVEDRGPGIDADDRPHLFEPFYRGQGLAAGAIPGSGLGLSLVRRIAEANRGSVSLAAGPGGRGSAFTLHLPVAPRAEEADRVERLEVGEMEKT
jgi:signal transduction histidine kinase